MTFEEHLATILDTRAPRVALKETPQLGPGRLARWAEMVEAFLPRDMNDRFSEARVASDFTPVQLQYLQRLSERDLSRFLDDDKLFRSIGVPEALGARRVWLGFDSSLGLSRPWPVEVGGATRKGTLWQALYIAYWWEEKPKKVQALLSELPPEDLFDFFYRWDEMSFDKKDIFCEAVSEYGRELLPKYLKAPSKDLLAWAERRAGEVRSGAEKEVATRDTWLVLAVLGSQLSKKASYPAEDEVLFLGGVPSVLDGAAGKKVWSTASEEWRLRFLRTKLKPFLSKEMPGPLVGQRFSEFKTLPLGAMKLSDAERMVIFQAAVRAWEWDEAMFIWETANHLRKAELGSVAPLEPASESERALRQWIASGCPDGDYDKTKQSSTYVLVEPGNISELSDIERAQFLAVGRHYFGKAGSEAEFVRAGLEQFVMFGFVKLKNRRGQRVGDAWCGFAHGRRFVGYLFEADQTEPLPDIHLGNGDFVGSTNAAHTRAQQAELKTRTSSWVEDRTANGRAALGL